MANLPFGPSRGIDATTMLTVYVCLLLAIPSAMVVAPMGSAGAPSAIMAIGAFFWWAWFHIHRSTEVPWEFQPVRAASLVWLLLMLIVYAHAMSSPIPSDEISPADNGMLKLVGFSGILLVANDGVTSMERTRTVLRRLVIGGGVIAALGLFQYATQQLWVDRIHIPGLTAGNLEGLATRNGLARPSGTSTHPIEYGVVLSMIFPVAVTFALKSPTRRWIYRGILCAFAFVLLLSISRSAVVCATAGLIILAMSWTIAARLRALAFVLAMTAVVYVAVPRTLGTLTRLFTGATDDPSIASRTGSYDIATEFISRSPLLGRGFGTFLPKYWILDNGYLGLLIEGGFVGLGGLLILILAGALAARQARQLAVDDFDRSLAQALLASIVAGACALAFFDTFAFPQSAGCFFLLLGVAGAARRLTRPQAPLPSLAPLISS
jgi:O-antigen ligase